jgi:CubicO group peptidase (beta-lactamase class C family)
MRRLVAAVAAVLLATACTAAPAPPTPTPAPDTHGIPRYLDGLADTHQFRGAVEVWRGDEMVVRQGFGQADVARDVRNDEHTRFRIGSVTKQFTALAVLMLQEDGRLRVGDRLCEYLPDCPAAWRAITLDQLLTHTSGLWDYNEMTEAEGEAYLAEYGDTPTPAQLLQVFAGRPLEFRPGAKWQYSNCGYDLLGMIVERLSGQPYGEFLQEHILGPLHMTESAYQPEPSRSDHDAVGYRDWTTPADVLPDAVNYASGGMYSTTTDLIRWTRFLLTAEPAIVTRDTLAELMKPRVDSAPNERYGYGIATRGTGDNATHGHGGLVNGFKSQVQIQPATELSIVVLSNVESANPLTIAENITALATTG